MGGGEINVPEGDYSVTARAYKNGPYSHSYITLETELISGKEKSKCCCSIM